MKISSNPAVPFRHLQRLTDTVGVIERADGIMPRYGQGYRVDDVARGLVVVCREPSPSAEMGGDAQVQGVEGYCEDQGPDREREEGGQNAVAEQRHGKEKGGTDQHFEQAARQASFKFWVGCGEGGMMALCA